MTLAAWNRPMQSRKALEASSGPEDQMQPITEAMELFRHQRAIRAWADRPVPDELVRQVLQAAIHAPSGSNTQPWHFIVVRDQAVKDRLTAIYDDALGEVQGVPTPPSDSDRQPLSAAPVLIVACVDTPDSGRAGFQTGASIYPACQNLMLAARALGLRTGLTTTSGPQGRDPRGPGGTRRCRERGDHPARLAEPGLRTKSPSAVGAVRQLRPLVVTAAVGLGTRGKGVMPKFTKLDPAT